MMKKMMIKEESEKKKLLVCLLGVGIFLLTVGVTGDIFTWINYPGITQDIMSSFVFSVVALAGSGIIMIVFKGEEGGKK